MLKRKNNNYQQQYLRWSKEVCDVAWKIEEPTQAIYTNSIS